MFNQLNNDLKTSRVVKGNKAPDLSLEYNKLSILDWNDDNDSTKSIKDAAPIAEFNTPLVQPISYKAPAVSTPKARSSLNLIWGMCIMSFSAFGLWYWIFTHEKIKTNQKPVTITESKTMAVTLPAYNLTSIKSKKEKTATETMRQQASHWLALGQISLKQKKGALAVKQLLKAHTFAVKAENSSKNILILKIAPLLANAYYLKGFVALEKKQFCEAKAEFINANKLAPNDQKIKDRLNEIALLSGC